VVPVFSALGQELPINLFNKIYSESMAEYSSRILKSLFYFWEQWFGMNIGLFGFWQFIPVIVSIPLYFE